MHTNDVCGGRRQCAWVEIETYVTKPNSNNARARARTGIMVTIMLSDAHHLGAAHTLVGASGTPTLTCRDPKESHFSAFSPPENCVSRSFFATAGLIRSLTAHYSSTLYSLSTDIEQTVS